METIFDFYPTTEELSKMDMTYKSLQFENYLSDLKQRAELFDTSFDYERISDLQNLAKLRGNDADFSRFTKMLEQDLGDIHERD